MKNKKLATFMTDGSGYWSRDKTKVDIIDFEADITVDPDQFRYGELRVYFSTHPSNPNSWNTRKLGLIYTDKRWLRDLHAFLKDNGFTAKAIEDVSYSEQGMQGDNYVSLDIGEYFIRELDPLVGFVNKRNTSLPIRVRTLT